MDEMAIEVKVLSCIYQQESVQALLEKRAMGLKLVFFMYPHTRKVAEATFTYFEKYGQLPSEAELGQFLSFKSPDLADVDRENLSKIIGRIFTVKDEKPGAFLFYRDQLKMNWMRHTAMNNLDKSVAFLEAGKISEFTKMILDIPKSISKETDSMVRYDPIHTDSKRLLKKYTAMAENQDGYTSIPTGLTWLDQQLGGGWRKGENYLGFGYTGRGKSFMGTQFGYHAAWHGWNVIKFTLEMNAEKDINRFYSRMTAIPHQLFFEPWNMANADWSELRAKIKEWQERKCTYFVRSPTGRITVEEIEAELLALPFDPDLLIIDQMTDIASTLEWKDMATVARDLQLLAKSWNREQGLATVTFGQAKTPTQWNPYLSVEDFAFGRPPCDWSTAVFYLAQTEEDFESDILRIGICKHRDGEATRSQGRLYPRRDISRIHCDERETREMREDDFPV